MEYSPMMLVVFWALAPSDALPHPLAAVETPAQVIETPQRVMSVQPLATFNYGKPFLGQPDPVTGAVEVKTTPLSEDDYIYEEFEESGESVDRKDGVSSINQIVTTSNKEAELHKFLNLPASYPNTPFKYPLISSSYANTKIQGHGASNHRPAPTSSTPSTMSPSYYTHRPFTLSTSTTPSTTTSTTSATTTTTTSTTTTPRPPTPPPPASHNYEYEDYYDYDKPHRGSDYDFLGSSGESSPSTTKAPSTTTTRSTPTPTSTIPTTTTPSTTTPAPTTAPTTTTPAPPTSTTSEPRPFTKFPDLRPSVLHSHYQATKDTSIVTPFEIIKGVAEEEQEEEEEDDEPEKNELNKMGVSSTSVTSTTSSTTTTTQRPEPSKEPTRTTPQVQGIVPDRSEWMQSGPPTQFRPPPIATRPQQQQQQPPPFDYQRPPPRPVHFEPRPDSPFGQPHPQHVDPTKPPIFETSYPPMLNFRPQTYPEKPLDARPAPEKRPQFVPPQPLPQTLPAPSTPPRDQVQSPQQHPPPKYDRPSSPVDLPSHVQTSYVKFERPHVTAATESQPSPIPQDAYVKFERPQVIPDRQPPHQQPQIPQQQPPVTWPKVRPPQQQSPAKPPYSFFPVSDNEHGARPAGIGSVEAVRPPPRPSSGPNHSAGPSDSQSYSLQTSFSIGVPPTKYQAPPWGEPSAGGHGNKPFKQDPLKRKPLPNILPQFRPNAKIGSVEPVPPPYHHHLSSNYPKEPSETLVPPPLPRPAFLRSEEPSPSPPQLPPSAALPPQPVHRRNGLGTKVTTLQMMQQPLPATRKTEEPVLIVYPSNNGDTKRHSSGTPATPIVDPEDSFLLDGANTRRVDTPILKGTKQHIKVEFPYPLLKPEEDMTEETSEVNSPPSPPSPSPSTSPSKEYNAFSPTAIAPPQEGDAEINVIPYLQDYQPFATKRPTANRPSVVKPSSSNSHTGDLWAVGSAVKPISVTLDTVASTQQAHQNHKIVSSGPPQPQDLEAPFAASPSHGWSVVNSNRTKETTETTSEETPSASVEETTNKEFNMSNFKPQLFGGFKPIVSPPEP